MRISTKEFRVPPGSAIALEKWPTRIEPLCKSKKRYRALLDDHIEQLSSLQRVHYASNRYSLLMIFQGMDTAGKDGAIRHVLSGVNPAGIDVHSFKRPSAEELQHDFLWRSTCRLPERGRIGIFNRSYYEEVLVVRVHPEILQGQRLPETPRKDGELWKQRYESIVDLERHLDRNGTRVLKIFLHLSKDEQKKRLIERIDHPEKNWKFSAGDLAERKLWSEYRKAYEACLAATSTAAAPWYVVPADGKQDARAIVSQIAIDALSELHEDYPRISPADLRELKALRKQL